MPLVVGLGHSVSPSTQGACFLVSRPLCKTAHLTVLFHHLCWPVSPPWSGMLWNGNAVSACSTPLTGHLTTRIRHYFSLPESPLTHPRTHQAQLLRPHLEKSWPTFIIYQSYLPCLTQYPAQTKSTEIVEQTVDMFFCDIYCGLLFGVIT